MSRVEVLPDSDDDSGQSHQVPVETNEEPSIDIARCDALKQEGNKLFVEAHIDSALARYLKAIQFARIKPLPMQQTHTDGKDGVNEKDPAATSTTPISSTAAAADDEKNTPPGSSAVPPAPDDDDTKFAADYLLTSQVMCNAATCLMKQLKFAEAEPHLTEALRHQPLYEKALLRRAECFYELGKWSSAHADWDTAVTKCGSKLDAPTSAKRDDAKKKTDEEMQKMLGQLKDLGNMFLGKFGLSTDNFKFDKDPNTGSYSMRFEK